MSWNYRVVAELKDEWVFYRVAEVYYNKYGVPEAWSLDDYNPVNNWDNLEDLVGTVKKLQDALTKPVLRVTPFGLEER